MRSLDPVSTTIISSASDRKLSKHCGNLCSSFLTIKQALNQIGEGDLANPFWLGLAVLARDIENLDSYLLSLFRSKSKR